MGIPQVPTLTILQPLYIIKICMDESKDSTHKLLRIYFGRIWLTCGGGMGKSLLGGRILAGLGSAPKNGYIIENLYGKNTRACI